MTKHGPDYPFVQYVNTWGDQLRTMEQWWDEVEKVYDRDPVIIRLCRTLHNSGRLIFSPAELAEIMPIPDWRVNDD